MNMLDKRRKRIFIVIIKITEPCWDYKYGQILEIPVVSNNKENARNLIEDNHSGGCYPSYDILTIKDTADWMFFMPDIRFKNLINYP